VRVAFDPRRSVDMDEIEQLRKPQPIEPEEKGQAMSGRNMDWLRAAAVVYGGFTLYAIVLRPAGATFESVLSLLGLFAYSLLALVFFAWLVAEIGRIIRRRKLR